MTKWFFTIAMVAAATTAFAQGAPGAPQNLTRVVSGTTVTLTWNPPTVGGVPTSYIVEAALVPGGAVIATLPVAGTTLTVPNVPSGVYYVRVRALNSAGQSAPSNEVVVTVGAGACPAPPQPPQFSVSARALSVTLAWQSSGGCAPTSYTVLAGTAPGLGNVAQVSMGGALGVSANAPAVLYYIRVIGSNAFGSASSQELAARIDVNNLTETIAPPFEAVFLDILMSSSGTLQSTLVWDDPTIDLDLYLTTPTCGYPPIGCTLAISDREGVNTEQVTRQVTTGERYRLWVESFSNRTTSFTITNSVSAGDAGASGDARSLTGDFPSFSVQKRRR